MWQPQPEFPNVSTLSFPMWQPQPATTMASDTVTHLTGPYHHPLQGSKS